MDLPHDSSAASKPPRLIGRFVAAQAIVWLLAAPILGIVVARAAVWAQDFRAPLLIFPLLVGCGLGLLLGGLMRLTQAGHRATILGGAVLAVAVTVVGQHYFSFRDYQAARSTQKPQDLSQAAFEALQDKLPDGSGNFLQFLQRQAAQGRPLTIDNKLLTVDNRLRGGATWASWAVDGLLTLIAALMVVHAASRGPYCSDCRSWYHTVRTGSTDAGTATRAAEAAAMALDAPSDDRGGEARYRLSHCKSGCGPSRLQLAWHGSSGIKVHEAWLSAAARERVMRALDGNSAGKEKS